MLTKNGNVFWFLKDRAQIFEKIKAETGLC